MQTVFYSLLIKENYQKNVDKGYIVYTRSKNLIVDIEIKPNDYKKLIKIIDNVSIV